MAGKELVAEMPRSVAAEASAELALLARIKFDLVRMFLWGWAKVFSLTGLYLLGQCFGTCEWLIDRKRRARFKRRLLRVFGEGLTPAMARRITRRHFARTRCDKLFYLIFDKLPREKILRRVRFHGKEILDEALSRGKGVYATLSHHGSHHVAGLLMALMGYKVAGVRDRNEGAIRRYVQDKYIQSFPEFRDIRVFFSDAFPRDLYRCLQEGRILASALDVDRQRGSRIRTETVKIFGQRREFITGTMQIALRCGSPILQGFVISRKNFYFRFVVLPPLADPERVRDQPEVLASIMQKYADNIEAHVRAYPCHISKV